MRRANPFTVILVGQGAIATSQGIEFAHTGGVTHAVLAGLFTIAMGYVWRIRRKKNTKTCPHHEVMIGPFSSRCTACGEKVSERPLPPPEDPQEKGPSLGAKPDGSGGYVGLFPANYFESYVVCPHCGLDALHWMRTPHPDEGHDAITSQLEYWKGSLVDHVMRDYEVIRQCKSCKVHWGQNALGVFPSPMLGPFAPTEAEWRVMGIPETSPVQLEPRRAKLVATGDVVMVNGVFLIPPQTALARAKISPADRQIYLAADGKYHVVVNGYIMASKSPNGTWSVPTNPTKWVETEPSTSTQAATMAEAIVKREAVDEWAREYWDGYATQAPMTRAASIHSAAEQRALDAEANDFGGSANTLTQQADKMAERQRHINDALRDRWR